MRPDLHPLRFPGNVATSAIVAALALGAIANRAQAYETRLNCGGFAYTTQAGDTYEDDRPWSPGGAGWTTFGFEGDTWQPIGGTDDSELPLHPSPVFRGVTRLPVRLESA